MCGLLRPSANPFPDLTADFFEAMYPDHSASLQSDALFDEHAMHEHDIATYYRGEFEQEYLDSLMDTDADEARDIAESMLEDEESDLQAEAQMAADIADGRDRADQEDNAAGEYQNIEDVSF